MVRVAPIDLAYNPRTLWFDPRDVEVRKGTPVVVLTARGLEYGVAASDVIEVSDEDVKALKSPLKPVKRLATEEDQERAQEMEAKSREALPVFKQMAAEDNADMHPVSVEFLLDGDKAVFYFEAEERVDFRDLVRKLAARFHVRIDMRQIGVRDEARMVGGLGHCGQELCCKRMGGEFCPVSIRMAKEQDLSLNPQKISGLCGRLMCCLRYEYDAYKDFKSRAPKVNATIQTPEGPAKVVELDVPREVVSLKLEGEKPVRVPLAYFDEPEEGARPTSIGVEGWEEAAAEAANGYAGDPVTFLTSQFTGSDKLAEAGLVRHTPAGKGRKSADGGKAGGSGGKGRGSRGGRGKGAARGSNAGTGAGSGAGSSAVSEPHKLRRRRSTKIAAGEAAETERVGAASGAGASAGVQGAQGAPDKPRRSRNRSHAVGSAREAGASERLSQAGARKGAGRGKAAYGGRSSAADGAGAQGAQGASKSERRSGQRPGQKSSGLARTSDASERSERSDREGAPKKTRSSRSRSGSGPRATGGISSRAGEGASERSDAAGARGEGANAQPHRRNRHRSHKPQQGKGEASAQGGSEQ